MLDVVIDDVAIRIGARFAASFHRTLRIPDDGKAYPLPPGLGRLPVCEVSAYPDHGHAAWLKHGGAFLPMYQREALWLGFSAADWKPNAVKICIGGVNAISGEPDSGTTLRDPQDYIVCPDQIWLDGINSGRGTIRQFVAMPLGLGYTVESAITHAEDVGGLQITVFEPKAGRFPDEPPPEPEAGPTPLATPMRGGQTQSLGFGAGGVMKQKIYPDRYGIDAWDQENRGQVFVHIVNSAQYRDITGREAPPPPIDVKTYTDHGFPWFELYDEHLADLPPPDPLTEVPTIQDRDRELGRGMGDASADVSDKQIEKLLPRESAGRQARDPSHPVHDPPRKNGQTRE